MKSQNNNNSTTVTGDREKTHSSRMAEPLLNEKKKKKTEFEVLGHSGNRIFASSSDEGQDKDNQILCLR